MTKAERKDPKLIAQSSSRRRRIAQGSGRKVSEVNRLITTLDQTSSAMKRMQGMDPSKINPNNPLAGLKMGQPTKKKKGPKKKRWRY